jgi:hypothetical protein
MLNKKGNLSMLQSAVVVLIVIGMVIVFGLKIMEGVQTGMTPDSASYNATGDMIAGISVISDNATTLVWVILGGVIIGILLYFFSGATSGRKK